MCDNSECKDPGILRFLGEGLKAGTNMKNIPCTSRCAMQGVPDRRFLSRICEGKGNRRSREPCWRGPRKEGQTE